MPFGCNCDIISRASVTASVMRGRTTLCVFRVEAVTSDPLTSKMTYYSNLPCTHPRSHPRYCVVCSLIPKTRITVDIRRYLTKRVLFVVQSWVVGEVFQCSDESAESPGNNASSSASTSVPRLLLDRLHALPMQTTSHLGGRWRRSSQN